MPDVTTQKIPNPFAQMSDDEDDGSMVTVWPPGHDAAAPAAPAAGATPANNDGRHFCFWCSGPTKRVELFTGAADVCKKCGR